MTVRWGFIGTGRICHDFALCLNHLPDSEHKIVAVADLTLAQAKSFASRYNIPEAYGSAEELAADSDVDIAYIATWNTDHFRITKLMLENGKHVLCEKPMGLNVQQVQEAIDIARRCKKFLMEGVWSCCCPIYAQMRKEISEGTIGVPNLVHVMFAFNGLKKVRVIKYHLGGSVIMDIGLYGIYLATLAFGGEKPEKITATGVVNEEGVDEVALISLEYSNQRMANITTSIRTAGWNEGIVSGTKGVLKLKPPFHCPTVMETPQKTYNIQLPEIDANMHHIHAEGLIYEAQLVRECLRNGLLECPLMTWKESLTIHSIMTEARRQLGAKEY